MTPSPDLNDDWVIINQAQIRAIVQYCMPFYRKTRSATTHNPGIEEDVSVPCFGPAAK